MAKRQAEAEKRAIEIAQTRRTDAAKRADWHAGAGPRPEPTAAQKRALDLPTERPEGSR